MPQKTIDFDDKVNSKSPTVPAINDIRDADINEIKGIVNDNASDAETRFDTIGSLVQNKIVHVADNGNDTTGNGSISAPYLTPQKALDVITDSTTSNRYTIKIAPGAYSINNPLVLKEGVYLDGQIDDAAVVLTAQNAALNIIEIVDRSGVNGVSLSGATTASGIYMGVSGITSCNNITFIDCQIGVHLNNASCAAKITGIVSSGNTIVVSELVYVQLAAQVVLTDLIPLIGTFTNIVRFANSGVSVVNQLVSNNNNIGVAVLVENGADVTLMNSRITGDLGDRIGTALKVVGDTSHLDCLSVYIQHADYGAYVDNTAQLHATGIVIDLCDQGVYTHTTGSPMISLHGGKITNSLTWDVYLSTSATTLRGSGLAIDEDKLFLDGADVAMSHISSNVGDEGMGIKGELHVGSPERPAESVFGEGDSYTRGLVAYSYNVTGSVYTDISELVKSYSGSTFTFPNLLADSAIYIGSSLVVNSTSDFHKAFGLKIDLVTAQVGGSIVAEYWNGSAWTAFNTMSAQSDGKFYRKSDQLFTADADYYQVRYNPAIDSDWTKNEPNAGMGELYWVRFRTATALTTAPIFEQWKLHCNRTEFNGDGYQETMANGREYVSESVPWSTFQDIVGSALGDKDLWLSSNCKAGYINNIFNSDGDNIGTVFSLPSWVDTSGAVKVSCVVIPTSTGDLTMTAYLNSSLDGDTIYTSNPASTVGEVSDVVIKSVTANQQVTFEFELDISDKGVEGDGIPAEAIWLNIETTTRPGGGDVYGMLFGMELLKWRGGSHV